MTHTDQSGNQYRQQGGEWQVMHPGVGWTPFTCEVDIELTSGETIPARPKQASASKWSESEKSFLISHSRDIHMQLVANYPTLDDELPDASGEYAVNRAKALIEALKLEGAL